jgi:elongation factor G
MTKGRAQYTMELDHYELVPPNVEKDLIGNFKRKSDDDE